MGDYRREVEYFSGRRKVTRYSLDEIKNMLNFIGTDAKYPGGIVAALVNEVDRLQNELQQVQDTLESILEQFESFVELTGIQHEGTVDEQAKAYCEALQSAQQELKLVQEACDYLKQNAMDMTEYQSIIDKQRVLREAYEATLQREQKLIDGLIEIGNEHGLKHTVNGVLEDAGVEDRLEYYN